MNEPVGSAGPVPPQKNNTPLIIGIVVVVLLCCCCIVGALGWQYGDLIMQEMNNF
jgi:hypothetical protein